MGDLETIPDADGELEENRADATPGVGAGPGALGEEGAAEATEVRCSGGKISRRGQVQET